MTSAEGIIAAPRFGGARLIGVGLGGLAALVLSVAGVTTLGSRLGLDDGGDPDRWYLHALGHVVIGMLVLCIGLGVVLAGRSAHGDRVAAGGLRIVSGLALVLSATQFIEAVGAYPPLDMLHIIWASLMSLPLLILGFLSIAAAGVIRLLRRI